MEIVVAFSLVVLVGLFLSFWSQNVYRGKKVWNCQPVEDHSLRPIPSHSGFLQAIKYVFLDKLSMSKFLLRLGRHENMRLYQLWNKKFVRALLINDLELGKQLFRNPVFCARETNVPFCIMSQGTNGIISASGKTWTEQRRFCYQNLKQFGFGTKSMELVIQHELEKLLDCWASKNGSPFSPNKSFYVPILNSIWVLLAGERASEDLIKLVQPAYDGFRETAGFPDFFTFMTLISRDVLLKIGNRTPFLPGLKLMTRSFRDLHLHFKKIISLKKQSGESYESPSNLVEAYLQRIRTTTDPQSQFFQHTGETHLIAIMTEFFMAGGDTTSNQLVWAMLHLIRNPDAQDKIRNEVDAATGRNRRLALDDRINCPFTEAFIYEVLRMTPMSLQSLPHAASENTNIGPYLIEKGTFVFLNIYSINNDPLTWGDPEIFRPQRFLSPDGKTVIRHEEMVTFSLGSRRCLGEQLALNELFIFIGGICQRFILKPDAKSGIPTLREMVSFLLIPQKFNMIAEARALD